MSKAYVVKIENLTKTFAGKEVIKQCHMHVETGSIYGFLGANGAGKTTVFKMLSGLLIPTMGKTEVLGMDILTHRDTILAEIGTLIETPLFYEHLSATENLEIHLAYMGVNNGNVDAALSKVGLNNTGDHPVSKFSLGMKQRLAIARAIVHQPKLLILDEPINGLDPMGIREMRRLFLDLVKNHRMTILISSHILSEIEHIADTIGVIVNGHIIEEVSLPSIKKQFPDGLEDYFFDLMSGGKMNASFNET
ncbi:ABC transporter ATP-binding protein [Oceanobacillus jeddahense]|uniref:ATP-binding cassette domain-containing protein n=1 Tax=Oceanobacillus jeddahense TaxID=1462527 RepID=A0ABY5JZD8_9BACI|nr:ATP-binding cassette domain-containing protein [Oceanobacillus jeddahense]UUI04421.1 ATP-binding cassette domain-containing protein [Oceanobacillus jeddahense]